MKAMTRILDWICIIDWVNAKERQSIFNIGLILKWILIFRYQWVINILYILNLGHSCQMITYYKEGEWD